MSVANNDSEQLAMDRAWVRLLSHYLWAVGLDEMWDTLSEKDRREQIAEFRHSFANTITPAMPTNWRARGMANGILDKVVGTEHLSDSRREETTPDDH